MKDELLRSGYKTFTPNKVTSSSDLGYQKRIYDDEGINTKYFITVYETDMSKYQDNLGMSYEVDLQFNKLYKGREYTFNITIFGFWDYVNQTRNWENISIEELEELIEDIWINNKFEKYD